MNSLYQVDDLVKEYLLVTYKQTTLDGCHEGEKHANLSPPSCYEIVSRLHYDLSGFGNWK